MNYVQVFHISTVIDMMNMGLLDAGQAFTAHQPLIMMGILSMRTYIPRASRVDLDLLVRYRVANGQDWLQTTAVNMSESGILFGPTNVSEGTEIEIIVSIPKSIEEFPAGEHFFVGEVVRTTGAGAAAAAFHEKRFLLES